MPKSSRRNRVVPETVMAKRVRAAKAASSLVASNPAAVDDQALEVAVVADDQQAEVAEADQPAVLAADAPRMVVAGADRRPTVVGDLGAVQDDLTDPANAK